MKKYMVVYAIVLALAAFLLEWLEYKYLTRAFSTEIYIALLALGFLVLGIWAGNRLAGPLAASKPKRNEAALQSLQISAREYEVLEHLAAGMSNKEIARTMEISPNTVKTHVTRLYQKLEVSRRTLAIQRAKDLSLIP